jgi:hypothetical protein
MHADVPAQCFEGSPDSLVFPGLGHLNGCHWLMSEIKRRGPAASS